MRSLLINSMCAALALGGCASKSSISLVVVSVDSDAPLADVATLHARVSLVDQTREFDVHPTSGATLSIPPAQTFGIDIPRSMSGTLAIHVEAHDSTGAVTASGDGSGPIRVGARADVAVHLATLVGGGDLGDGDGGDMAVPPGSDMAKPTGDMVAIPPAMLTIDKTTQSFGDITVGKTSTTASFLVINAGGMPTSVATLTPGGANVGEFAIDTDCGPSLAPGGRCHVTASVAPTSPGMKSATFTLSAAQGGSVGGTLTANALTQGAVKIVQSSGDCGSALIGVQSTTTATFTVQNSGASPTTALTVGTSDAQFLTTGCSGVTLAAGAMCTVTVKFTPSARGTQNASLTVSATTGGTDTASVVGVGLKGASLRVSPTSYTFASAPRLSTTGPSQAFTVTNDGDVASQTMGLATVTGSGVNAQSFTIANDACQGTQVGPAPSSCAITLQFTPQLTGANSATLNINTSTGTAIMVPLTGTGAPIWVQEATDLTLQNLNAVWAADASHIYAVGEGGTIVYRDSTNKWSLRTLSASPLPSLQSVYGSSSTDVFVAGGGIFLSTDNSTWSQWQAGSFTGLILFGARLWGSFYAGTGGDGVYWTPPAGGWVQVTNANGAIPGLGKLWGTSSSDVYTYGQTVQCAFGSCSSAAQIIHTDSSGNWASQYSVGAPNPTAEVDAIFGFGSPANNLYAVTSVGTKFLHSTGNGTWTDLSGAPSKHCASIWGVDAADLWFGCYGGIYAFDGTSWTGPMVTTANIRGLFGTGVSNVYAVGDDGSHGVIYHYY